MPAAGPVVAPYVRRGALPVGRAPRARRMAPFLAVNALAFALSPLGQSASRVEVPLLLLAAGLVALVAVVLVVAPWPELGLAPRVAPVIVYTGAVVVLREASGGAASGYTPLLLLPVIWMALYGNRREMAWAIALATTALVLPIVVIGGARYPVTEWRRSALLLAVAALIGTATQQLVWSNRRRERTLVEIADLNRALTSDQDDVASRVCLAAVSLTGADMAAITEPQGDRLVVTGSAGIESTAAGAALAEMAAADPSALSTPLESVPAPVAEALRTGRTVFVADTEQEEVADSRVRQLLEHRSVMHEPVLRNGRVRALLSVMWRQEQRQISAPVAAAVRMLADEAALAIERSDLVARLDALARHDPLTGLLNRRAWDDRLAEEVHRARRTGRPMSLLMVDLDHFKRYNDEHGHPSGDLLLKEVAAAWSAELRPTDVLARWGGEEFAVILPESNRAQAVYVFARFQRVMPRGQSVSGGVAGFPEITAEALVPVADEALYRAKCNGRARVEIGRPQRGQGGLVGAGVSPDGGEEADGAGDGSPTS